jgi:hypothetical protein
MRTPSCRDGYRDAESVHNWSTYRGAPCSSRSIQLEHTECVQRHEEIEHLVLRGRSVADVFQGGSEDDMTPMVGWELALLASQARKLEVQNVYFISVGDIPLFAAKGPFMVNTVIIRDYGRDRNPYLEMYHGMFPKATKLRIKGGLNYDYDDRSTAVDDLEVLISEMEHLQYLSVQDNYISDATALSLRQMLGHHDLRAIVRVRSNTWRINMPEEAPAPAPPSMQQPLPLPQRRLPAPTQASATAGSVAHESVQSC